MLVLIRNSDSEVRIRKWRRWSTYFASFRLQPPPFTLFAIVCNAATQRRQAVTPQLAAVLAQAPRAGLFILSQPDSQPVSYRAAAFAVMKVRKEIGAEDYDIHALRHTTASELAALGLSDELIMAVTGHTSRASVVRYAGAARQKARAKTAQDARNRTKTKRET